MFKKIRLGIWLGLLLIVWGVPGAALAQGNLSLASAEVDLWPEYDRPTMLVIYHIRLKAGILLPASLSIRLPSRVGDPNAVAARQADGSLINIDFKRQVNGDLATLTLQAPTTEVQIEYYDPGLTRTGNVRKFTYTWPGDYSVDALTILVQQPRGAGQMKITPAISTSALGGDGLMYYTANLGSVTVGQTVSLNLEYPKDTDVLTSAGQEVLPITPVSQLKSGLSWLTTVLPWLLGALGLILIMGGGYWYWRTGLHPIRNNTRSFRHKPASQRTDDTKPELAGKPDPSVVYCHECGNRASSGDRFCRVCGTQLRTG